MSCDMVLTIWALGKIWESSERDLGEIWESRDWKSIVLFKVLFKNLKILDELWYGTHDLSSGKDLGELWERSGRDLGESGLEKYCFI